jgi:hypothetical protein
MFMTHQIVYDAFTLLKKKKAKQGNQKKKKCCLTAVSLIRLLIF